MSDAQPLCRSCGKGSLAAILSLGRTPLANALLTVEQLEHPEPTYPLELVFCPHCALVQITETVPPEKLFREYLYYSSFSDAMLRHAQSLVGQLIRSRHLNSNSLAVEVASNDGYLLQYYKQANIPVLGVEPAVNIARVARAERGIPTLCEFFGSALAQRLVDEGRPADVIHANNVLAHVADLNGFVEGIRILLQDDGVAVIEVPYIKDLMDRCEFDTIYHEHLCYFSLTALAGIFQRHGLAISDIERIPIHGGSLRLFVNRESAAGTPNPAVEHLLKEESEWGVDRAAFYQSFGAKVEQLRKELLACLHDLKKQGKRIAVYGASAKGSTLLNYCGIGKETVDFVVDRSTVKQGRYTPGLSLAHLFARKTVGSVTRSRLDADLEFCG